MNKLPDSELPRERLQRCGAEALSLGELLAILLVTGTQGKSVLMLAQELVAHFGGLLGLLDASIEELIAIKGIGSAKAIQLHAAFALARRAQKASCQNKILLDSVEVAVGMARQEIAHYKQEVLLVMLRDAKARFIHSEKIAMGTLSEVMIHPREVFYPAVRYKAHSLILAHNHPSGDPTPSKADVEMSQLLMHSSRVMGIDVVDHLIIGSDNFISMKRQGFFHV